MIDTMALESGSSLTVSHTGPAASITQDTGDVNVDRDERVAESEGTSSTEQSDSLNSILSVPDCMDTSSSSPTYKNDHQQCGPATDGSLGLLQTALAEQKAEEIPNSNISQRTVSVESLLSFTEGADGVAQAQAALQTHGVLCPNHLKEEYAASPTELIKSVLNQKDKVKWYMQTWNAQNLTDKEVVDLWNEAKIPLLILRCAMNTALFPNPFMGKEVLVLSTKTGQDPRLLYACPDCHIGRLVIAIRAKVMELLTKLDLGLEQVVKLEDYIFLTPRQESGIDLVERNKITDMQDKIMEFLVGMSANPPARQHEIYCLHKNLRDLQLEFSRCVDMSRSAPDLKIMYSELQPDLKQLT
jgi:hypothetical protein